MLVLVFGMHHTSYQFWNVHLCPGESCACSDGGAVGEGDTRVTSQRGLSSKLEDLLCWPHPLLSLCLQWLVLCSPALFSSLSPASSRSLLNSEGYRRVVLWLRLVGDPGGAEENGLWLWPWTPSAVIVKPFNPICIFVFMFWRKETDLFDIKWFVCESPNWLEVLA